MKFSLRVGFGLWWDETRRAELVQLLSRHADLIRDVWLFTAYEHGVLALDEIRRRCEVLAPALDACRDAGVRAGINHLGTAGHGSEVVPRPLEEPCNRTVGVSGAVGGYCLGDQRFIDYTRDAYATLARTGADFLWIDDDVRMERASGGMACFCENCLAEFSQSTGEQWSRESLVAALDEAGDRAESLRRKWLARNRAHLAAFLAAIREAVDRERPGLPLGFMTAELSYSGYGHARWAEALGAQAGREVMWRPGHGFYNDDAPRELLLKAASVGRQLSFLPEQVTDTQYEHESFPHQMLAKSQRIFAAECVAAGAVGCSGAALNCVPMSESDPLGEYEPRFAVLKRCKGFFDQLISSRRGRRPTGLHIPVSADHYAFVDRHKPWAQAAKMGRDFDYFQQMFSLGLSQAFTGQDASVTLLHDAALAECSDDQLRQILSGGVFLDAAALPALVRRGFGQEVGFEPAEVIDEDGSERFGADAINEGFVGWHRNARRWFCGGTFQTLRPRPGARVLSNFIDYHLTDRGPVSGVYENDLGGRIFVGGYYPWIRLLSLAKFRQTHRLMRWLSADRLDGEVTTFARTALWTFAEGGACDLAVVMNVGLDPLEDVDVRLRGPAEQIELIDETGQATTLSPSGEDACPTYTIPRLDVWHWTMLRRRP
jgi:hypothetical protein